MNRATTAFPNHHAQIISLCSLLHRWRMPRMKYTLIGLAVLLTACGSSPTSPTPQSPSITGQWTGTYRVTTCTEPQPPTGLCQSLGGGGSHTLTPSQNGGSFTGQLGLGTFAIPVSGNVGADQVVTLAGSGPVSTATLTVNTWRAVIAGTTMTGTMTFSVFGSGQTVTVSATTSLAR
jgi:hypothetical protein